MTCNPSYYLPTTGCGSHGLCVGDTARAWCECEEGWSHFGEFSILDSNPCDIHLTTVRVFNGVAVLGAVIAAAAAIWSLASRYRSLKDMSGKHWRIWGLPLTVLVFVTFHIPYCILRVVEPTTFVAGMNLPATVLWFFLTFLFCQQMLLALSIFVRVSEGVTRMRPTSPATYSRAAAGLGARGFSRCPHRGELLIWIVWACGIVVCALPILAVYYPETLFIVIGIQGGTVAVMFVIFGMFSIRHTLNSIVEALTKTIEATAHMQQHAKTSRNAQLRRILLKTRVAQRVAMVGFPVFASTILLFSLWPFLVIKGAYFVPVILFCAEMTCVVILWITTTTSTNDVQKRLSEWASPLRKRSSGTGGASGDKRKSLQDTHARTSTLSRGCRRRGIVIQ